MATSYNGWTAAEGWSVSGGQLAPLVVAGEPFSPGVRAGDVRDVFEYLANQLHRRVEPVVRDDWHQADDWGYSFRANRNADNLSCHASGTAIDYNATRHPNDRSGTFTAAQVAEIRAILAELDGVVKWGGDFSGTRDEMHWEVRGTAAQVAAVAARLRGPVYSPIVGAMQLGMHFTESDRDGIWGPLTDRAVYVVRQAFVGLFPEGVARAEAIAGTEQTGTWTTADAEANRTVISVFQRAWGVGDDGYWGPITEKAWKTFQARLCTT